MKELLVKTLFYLRIGKAYPVNASYYKWYINNYQKSCVYSANSIYLLLR
jgi:hypothetical protein